MSANQHIEDVVIQLGLVNSIWIVIGILAVQFLLAEWLKARLSESIRFEYAQQIEEYKNEIKIREQSARVAELLAEALSGDPDPKRYNRLSWELALWLPANIYSDLKYALCEPGNREHKHYKEVLIDIRKTLLKDPGNLKAEEIVHRNPEPSSQPR